MIARGNVRKLIIVLGTIQDKVGEAKGLHDDDRSIGAFEKAQRLLEESFDLCVEAHGMYDPITRRNNAMKSLSELLEEVDALFVHASRKPSLATYDYSLGRFPYGWNFSVVNSWHKWSDAKLKNDFGSWNTPEGAVQEFLDYVKKNKINVKSLMDKSVEEKAKKNSCKAWKKTVKSSQQINGE
jgi:hypothetical protein